MTEREQYLEMIQKVEIESRILYLRDDGTWEWRES